MNQVKGENLTSLDKTQLLRFLGDPDCGLSCNKYLFASLQDNAGDKNMEAFRLHAVLQHYIFTGITCVFLHKCHAK